MVIYGLQQENIKGEDITLEILEEIYPKYNQICKENEEIKEQCAEITKQMQEGHKEYNKLHKIILKIDRKSVV